MNSATALGQRAALSCYHCGEEVPPGQDFSLAIAGEIQPMCCPGCRAVASIIADSGLERFYAQRTAFNNRPTPDQTSQASRWVLYDDPSLQSQFCETRDSGLVDARLLIGGITCAACTWLIETTVERLPGVVSASLNLGQSRLDLSFEPSSLRVSEVFGHISALGYTAKPWHSSAQQDLASREFKSDLRRLAVAGIGMMQVGMFAIALHAGELQGISEDYQLLLRWVSLLVTGFIVYFSAGGFFESAWRHLRHGALVMDLPVALAIGLAFGASVIATLFGIGQVYFDSVVMFTFLLLLARFVEKRLRFRDALAWRDAEQSLPDHALAWRGEDWLTIPRRDLTTDDRVLVRAGDTIPIDGIILLGESAVREDSFSGEAVPRPVKTHDTVYAGTLNLDGTLEISATGSYANTRLAALQRALERAQRGKPAVAKLADRIASVFIAGVLGATVVTALVWWQIDAGRAFWIALSVLVISCPCALSLATPAALANAAAALRRSGVIVNGENALESLARTTHVLFDKTGTLSTGAFTLAHTQLLTSGPWQTPDVHALAAAMQRHSNHPIASAFAQVTSTLTLVDTRHVIGAGMEARLDGRRYRLGSGDFCRGIARDFPQAPDTALYWIGLSADDEPLAWLGLRDALRPEARHVIDTLRQRGLSCELLTGDASPRARDVGRLLGFDQVYTGQSPQQKLERVAALQAQGATVLMVGDGLNDAPVLKQADASIAVADATDLARSQADFVVIDGDLRQVSAVHATARRTRRIIMENFSWALGYNTVGIPFAALGWIPPWMAAIGMSLSSLLVVANATRLRRVARAVYR